MASVPYEYCERSTARLIQVLDWHATVLRVGVRLFIGLAIFITFVM
jgi:hypothetical protein